MVEVYAYLSLTGGRECYYWGKGKGDDGIGNSGEMCTRYIFHCLHKGSG